METRKSFLALPFSSLLIFFLIIISLCEGKGSNEELHVKAHEGPLVKKSQIKTIVDAEYGEISSIMVKEGHKTPPYHLQFFTLEPNSVFLPVLLHADMVFYVYTGSGRLTWANEDGGTGTIDLREGDVCSLGEGFVFYIHSNLEAQRNKLRIYAMFSNTEDSTFESSIGAYSRINNLVKGFDKKIMQAAFKVPEDLVEAITNKTETPAIVHAVPEKREKKHKHNSAWELEALFLNYYNGILSNSKKLKTYNIFTNKPDFKNVHGWTTTVTKKQLKQLKRHNIGFLMVNLTMGSMLGPHWNPRATEIAVVLQGEGMVRVVCGSSNENENKDECQNKRFRVKQGDVFVVPRFHPMAHMSFENEPLAFMGFSTAAKKNNPQFLVGKGSVLEILDRQILATSLGVSNRTIDKLLASPDESIIFSCDSCAEEEERLMKEEEEKEKEDEEKRKKEEKEEEETEKSKEEEEEEVRRREKARKREEEAARRQQEERERRREEEEARRQEEKRREEEEVRREKEAERKREKARRQREEEEEARREREKEAERKREKARRQREEEEEARREREKEKEAEAREEEQRREEEEEAEREQEKARRQQEEREKKREEAAAREEEQRREEAAAKRREEKERRREEEAERERERGREEPAEGEEEAARRQQEEREKRREEEGERETEEEHSERERGGGRRRRRQKRREEEGAERGGEEEEPAEGEEEAARRQQEEREKRREEEGEREREEEQSERERGGGRRRRQRRGEERGDESETSWEEEEARREQEERESRREWGRDNKSMKRKVEGRSFEGRRVLKMRNVNV